MKTITDHGVVTGTNRGSKRAKVVWRHWQAAWRMRGATNRNAGLGGRPYAGHDDDRRRHQQLAMKR